MKGPEAFRTISEAAQDVGVPQHVLRFWETKFSFIRPMKRAGGRRFYRPQDLAMLRGVRALLHEEGYTIKGVQRLHKEQGMKRILQTAHSEPDQAARESPPPDVEAGLADSSPVLMFGPSPDRPLTLHEQGRLQGALDELLAVKARLRRLIDDA